MKPFKRPPAIEFSDTQRQQLFAHARNFLWNSLMASAFITFFSFCLVMMNNPDKSVNNLLLMFGVFFTVNFLFSIAGWGYDESGSIRRELPLSRENEFQLK